MHRTPRKYSDILMCENCDGNNIFNSKNCHSCWLAVDCEDCSYCDGVRNMKDCYDVSYYGCTNTNELLYECEGVGHGIFNSKFCKLCWGNSQNLEYCYECFNCQDCFGCVGLKKAKFCIFNQQYTEAEYHELRKKIIVQMMTEKTYGEFFPIALSPFGYNQSIAHDYLPLTKEKALAQKYHWQDDEPRSKYVGEDYVIPAKIEDTPDTICSKILQCEQMGRNYKIQAQELKFYRKMELPVPRHCPEVRHEARMRLRNPRQLWQRQCQQCNTSIQTPCAPDRPEKILCEKCYLKTVN